MQSKAMQSPDDELKPQEVAAAEASSETTKRRGPKSQLTAEQKRENKRKSCKKYRDNKNAWSLDLLQKNQELKKEKEEWEKEKEEGEKEKETLQSKIKSLKEDNSEINARADKLAEKVKRMKMVNKKRKTRMQQLKQSILSQEDQAKSQELLEKYQKSEKEKEEWKKEAEALQFEINSLKEENSEINAQADKFARELSDESKKVKRMKMANEILEPEMQQLQQKILNPDDQEHHVENCGYDIPMDDNFLNSLDPSMLGDFSHWLDP